MNDINISMMAKRMYIKMELTRVGFEPENMVLSGSVSDIPMKVNKVEVEPYVNGFGENTDNFTGISFD